MNTRECINWLEHFKRYCNKFNIEPDCLIASDKNSLDIINCIIKRLQMWEDFKKRYGIHCMKIIEKLDKEGRIKGHGNINLFETMNDFEEKYFSKLIKKKLIVDIEAKDQNMINWFKNYLETASHDAHIKIKKIKVE